MAQASDVLILPNKTPAVSNTMQLIFLNGKTWEWSLLQWKPRIKSHWSDLATDVRMESGSNTHPCNVRYYTQRELSH